MKTVMTPREAMNGSECNMTNKEAIINVLMDRFRSVYCNTCVGNGDMDYCDMCHRKNMNWGLSRTSAGHIADLIIQALDKNK